MSKEIKFDKITIRDFGDDLFDPVKDQVTSATGKPLSPSEKKLALNNILKELGVKSWAGILLSRASVYLDQMKQARESAPKGEVEATRTALAHAKTVSQQLFLIHNQKESDELLKKALAQGAELSMKNAETLAPKFRRCCIRRKIISGNIVGSQAAGPTTVSRKGLFWT
jgi:hypothetical protein